MSLKELLLLNLLLLRELLIGDVRLLLLSLRIQLLFDLEIVLGVTQHHVVIYLPTIVLHCILRTPRLLLEIVLVKNLLTILLNWLCILICLYFLTLSSFLTCPSFQEIHDRLRLVILLLPSLHVGVGRGVWTHLLGVG
jgi:hypothetical protein